MLKAVSASLYQESWHHLSSLRQKNPHTDWWMAFINQLMNMIILSCSCACTRNLLKISFHHAATSVTSRKNGIQSWLSKGAISHSVQLWLTITVIVWSSKGAIVCNTKKYCEIKTGNIVEIFCQCLCWIADTV